MQPICFGYLRNSSLRSCACWSVATRADRRATKVSYSGGGVTQLPGNPGLDADGTARGHYSCLRCGIGDDAVQGSAAGPESRFGRQRRSEPREVVPLTRPGTRRGWPGWPRLAGGPAFGGDGADPVGEPLRDSPVTRTGDGPPATRHSSQIPASSRRQQVITTHLRQSLSVGQIGAVGSDFLEGIAVRKPMQFGAWLGLRQCLAPAAGRLLAAACLAGQAGFHP